MSSNKKEVCIDYTNYRGERTWRRILPLSLSFENSEWHPNAQWILEAVDVDRGVVRGFAFTSIHGWRTVHE